MISQNRKTFTINNIFIGLIKKKKDQTKVNKINQNLVKEKIKTIFYSNDNIKYKINEFKLLTLSNNNFVPKNIDFFSYIIDKPKNILSS